MLQRNLTISVMIGGEACKSLEMGQVSIRGAEKTKAFVYQMGIVLQ